MTRFVLWLNAWMLSATAYAIELKLCDDLIIQSKDKLTFTKTERLFLCGDSDNRPWSAPTESQIKLLTTSFLQSRGYYTPTFRREDKILVVDVGDKTRVKSITADKEPIEIDFTRFWVPWRKTLTPTLLDEYEDLVTGRVESKGYPCPSVNLTASAVDGSMEIDVDPGPRLKVAAIDEADDLGLRPGTLRRYYPIKEGDWFNGDLMHIANERIKATEILGSSYMVATCEPEGAVIHHRSVISLPRRMTIGAGFNTETYVVARATYQSTRLDANASSFSAIMSANYFRQHVESNFEWYFLPFSSSLHFKPSLAVDRINEASSEERKTKAEGHFGAYGDIGTESIRGYIGPNLKLIRTLRGTGPAFARILELEANSRIMSHAYEFYRGAPRSGHLLNLRYTTASEQTYSTLAVRTYSAKGEILFNTASLEPPLVVLGFRANAAGSDAAPDVELPDEYLYYIGGSDDVRGFRRRTVPSASKGARSILSGGMEMRLVTVVPYGIQPFVFLDAGKLGQTAFKYDDTVYYSPGAGIRWQSPFGSLRGSVARGLIKTNDEERAESFHPQWVAFVSFGEEF